MKISCCIPTYQPYRSVETFRWLEQALRSAEPFDEIILAVEGEFFPNDHKDEPFFKKLKVFQVPYDPTPLHKRLDVGPCYNFVASKASNEWISFLADDDFYMQDGLKQILAQEHDDADIIYFPQIGMSAARGNIEVWKPPSVPFTLEQLTEYCFLSNCCPTRKSIFDSLGGRKKGVCDDWDFWIRAVRAGARFKYFPTPIYTQRFRSDSCWRRQEAVWGRPAIKEHMRKLANGEL